MIFFYKINRLNKHLHLTLFHFDSLYPACFLLRTVRRSLCSNKMYQYHSYMLFLLMHCNHLDESSLTTPWWVLLLILYASSLFLVLIKYFFRDSIQYLLSTWIQKRRSFNNGIVVNHCKRRGTFRTLSSIYGGALTYFNTS